MPGNSGNALSRASEAAPGSRGQQGLAVAATATAGGAGAMKAGSGTQVVENSQPTGESAAQATPLIQDPVTIVLALVAFVVVIAAIVVWAR